MRLVLLLPRATRAGFLSASLAPAALGCAWAAWRGCDLSALRVAATLAGAALLHLGINVLNDVGDALGGADAANPAPGPFSGGSRVIQEGILSVRTMTVLGCTLLVLGGALGLWLNATVPGNAVLVIGLVGVALGVLYSLGPRPLGYTPLGLVSCVVAFGPVIASGAYAAQGGGWDVRAAVAGLPIGLFLGLLLHINQVPDRAGDAAVGKNTHVVLLPAKAAAPVYAALAAATYGALVVVVLFGLLPALSLAALMSLPLAVFALRVCARFGGDPRRIRPANAATIALHGVNGLILVTSLVLASLD